MSKQTGSKLRPVIRKQRGSSRFATILESKRHDVDRMLDSLDRQGAIASQAAFNRASRWQVRMAAGNDTDYRTPFYAMHTEDGLEYPKRSEVVEILDAKVSGISSGDPYLDRILQGVEDDQKKDIGPISMFLPWLMDGPEKAKKVYQNKEYHAHFNKAAWERALERLESLVGPQSQGVLSVDMAVNGMTSGGDEDDENVPVGLDTTTNSGAPYFITPWRPTEEMKEAKFREVDEAYNYYIATAKSSIREMRSGAGEYPLQLAIASQRLVQKGPEPYNPKSKRLVIAFPKDEAIIWKTFTPPLMETLRKVRSSNGVEIMCAWNDLRFIDERMQTFLRHADSQGRTVLSGDVSNFDATLPPSAIVDVGRVVATWVRGYTNLIQGLVYRMVFGTGLITPDKYYEPGPSSLKSGSGGTNLLGSLLNLAIQYYGEEVGFYKLDGVCVLGDDFILDGEGVSPEATAETFEHFNMESHPDKQFYEARCLHYLQRLHYLGRPGGMSSIYRTIGHALGLERTSTKAGIWNRFAYILRALGQLQNCVFNPWFPQLVETLKEGDNLKLGQEFSDPMDLVEQAGPLGTEILREDINAPWKRTGANTSFRNWAVNGVVRGEVLPEPGEGLFERVYG